MGREETFAVHSGFPVVARIPLLPAESSGRSGPVLTGSLLEAVRFASRALRSVTDESLDADERLATTIRAYELRARTRATPRGAFAGVQVAYVADGPARFRIATGHRARSVPSGTWLSEMAGRLLDAPGVLEGLRLSANDLVVRRGDRFEHEHVAGAGKPERVTVRATPAVELIMQACRTPARLDAITAAVDTRWPGVPAATVRTAMLDMVRAGLLLTDLLPDDVTQDPLGHLMSRVPIRDEVTATLAELRDLLDEADSDLPGTPGRLAGLTRARELCDGLARHENPIVIDVAADADIGVPTALIAEAVQAAGLLWSITPAAPVLDAYHARFIERYGTGRRVRLEDVVDPVTGLGSPDDGERDSPAHDPGRARVLAGLVASAAAQGATEVILSEATIEALRIKGDATPPPGGELYVKVLARSSEDLIAGRYELAAYLGSTCDAGSTIGRFASLLKLPAPDQEDGPLPAEVVVRPRLAALTTVCLPSGFARRRICVGVVPGPGDLTLSDLELASDGQRLRLWSRSLDCEIAPALYSRIGPAYIAPAVRLLQDLACAGTRPWHTWTWGPLSAAPFVPRIRWRRTILAPAHWRLPHDLVTVVKREAAWAAGLQRWRRTTVPRPPRVVVAQDADQRIPLDLDDPRDRDLLRRYVRRGADTVTEEPGGSDALQAVVDGPGGRHVLELVIPFQRRRPHPAPQDQRHPAVAAPPVVYLPGGPWLSLTITSPAIHHDDLLVHVGEVAATLRSEVDRWFWLRYDATGYGPHVRVRFAGDPLVLNGTVLPAISAQCATWMARGLVGRVVVEPYEPEIDRYGGPDAIEHAERFFHADSGVVLRLLADRPDDERRLLHVALSAVALTHELADGDPAAVGRPRLDRAARRRVNNVRATAASGSAIALDADAQAAWSLRSHAAVEYRDALPVGRRPDCASSLIHMHANRMGLGHELERVARALAADLLIRGRR